MHLVEHNWKLGYFHFHPKKMVVVVAAVVVVVAVVAVVVSFSL